METQNYYYQPKGKLRVSDYAFRMGKGYLYNQVPGDLWKLWYREKNELLTQEFGKEVSWMDFYKALFPPHSLQPFNYWLDENGQKSTRYSEGMTRQMRWAEARAEGKGNVIALREDTIWKNGKPSRRRKPFLIYDERYSDIEPSLHANSKCLISPVSYFGRRMTKRASHELFAVVIDLDYVAPGHIEDLLGQCRSESNIRVLPSFIINSGRGLHLYFLLEEPVHLYEYAKEALTKLKNNMVDIYWNETTSLRPFKKDHGSIVQDFRAVGSRTKLDFNKIETQDKELRFFLRDTDYIVRAWQCYPYIKRFTLEELNEISMPGEAIDIEKVYSHTEEQLYDTTPLDQAREKWPIWYEQMLLTYGDEENWPTPQKHDYKYPFHFVVPRSVYDNFLAKAKTDAFVGGRFNTLKALCAIGIKCSDYHETRNPNPVTDEEIIADVWSLFPIYQSLGTCESEKFTRMDVEDALKALEPQNREFSRRFKREWIEAKTEIHFPPAIKRNGKPRKVHLKKMNFMRDEILGMADTWREGNGRPDKAEVVRQWRLDNPNGRKADCIRETGLSKPTVYKWWE